MADPISVPTTSVTNAFNPAPRREDGQRFLVHVDLTGDVSGAIGHAAAVLIDAQTVDLVHMPWQISGERIFPRDSC